MMIVWDRIVRNLRAKWFVLAGIFLAIFGVLELVTPDGAVEFLIANLTLVPATAEYRVMTNELVIAVGPRFSGVRRAPRRVRPALVAHRFG